MESSPETGVVVGGIAFDFPESDTVSFSSPRRKLKKRLIEARTPTTHLRRQVPFLFSDFFYFHDQREQRFNFFLN